MGLVFHDPPIIGGVIVFDIFFFFPISLSKIGTFFIFGKKWNLGWNIVFSKSENFLLISIIKSLFFFFWKKYDPPYDGGVMENQSHFISLIESVEIREREESRKFFEINAIFETGFPWPFIEWGGHTFYRIFFFFQFLIAN